jgi:hypothetical protein
MPVKAHEGPYHAGPCTLWHATLNYTLHGDELVKQGHAKCRVSSVKRPVLSVRCQVPHCM